MTVEAITAPELTPEERLRSRALDAIRSAALEVTLASDEPLRTVDMARLVAERLELQLGEEEMGGLASVVRLVLDSDPLFSQANRMWDLALRMGRAEGDRRKPVERAFEDFIDLLGHPSEARPVAVLTAAVYGRDPEYYERMLERVVPTREAFFRLKDGRAGICRWLIEISSDDPEEVEYDNFEDASVLERLRPLAEGVEAADPAAFARALIEKADFPVDNRALQFLAWTRFPDLDPKALFNDLYMDGNLVLERGPAWVTRAEHRQVLDALRGLTAEPEETAELVAATVPAEEEEIGILAPTTVRVSDEDLEQVHHYMQGAPRTYRIPELCQQVLEAFPGSRSYTQVHASLSERVREDARFLWVGAERIRIAGTIPAEVEVLPEGLAFDDREYLDEEGTDVDRSLSPDEWKHGLLEQVLDYLVQDVGDDSTPVAAETPTQIVSSPPLHHYVAGTRYIRNSDRGFFPNTPELAQVTLIPNEGEPFDVWINNRLSLIFGLKEWYDANLPWVGGRFVIERTEQADEYRLTHSGETEPLMEIAVDRLQELLTLRSEVAESPLTEIILSILKAHPEGIHFVTLFTEVNVIRRVRRAQVASVLSAQRYFSQREPGIWIYDEKRAAKGKGKKKGGPRRPMREFEEDDEEFEYE